MNKTDDVVFGKVLEKATFIGNYEDDKLIIKVKPEDVTIKKIEILIKDGKNHTKVFECYRSTYWTKMERFNEGKWINYLNKIHEGVQLHLKQEKINRFKPVNDSHLFA